ncbi:MAG: M20/M25/M40 family metallo-hydrolase, partial [Gemmatimonadales bacterium]
GIDGEGGNVMGVAEADVALVSDMPYFAPGYPAVYSSLRGICYAELRVRTLDGDLHSGMYGGLAPNAHETLVRMLHKLKAENGRIRIPGLYDSVARPPKAQRELWAKLPSSDTGLRREMGSRALTGIQTHPPLERLWALPTFEIHGISGGFTGQGAKTVIPAEATAKISLRLVPNQKEREVRRLLKRAVKVVTPSYAKSELTFVHGGDPVLVDTDRPAFDSLNAAYEEVEGRTAVEIRSGGSIPIVPALAKRGAAVVLTGIGLPDDAFHAPNEKLSVDQFLKGIRIYGSFLRRLGA